jgi:hypothetical protein
LPQTPSPEWEQELGTESKEVYNALVHTFGNLTLTAYNSELSNLPFAAKKDKLNSSHIELNRWILEQANWRAAEIEERARSLLSRALEIWSASLS